MKTNYVVHDGIRALTNVLETYTLLPDVLSEQTFKEQSTALTAAVFDAVGDLCALDAVCNGRDADAELIGAFTIPLPPETDGPGQFVREKLPHLFAGDSLYVPVRVDFNRPYNAVICLKADRECHGAPRPEIPEELAKKKAVEITAGDLHGLLKDRGADVSTSPAALAEYLLLRTLKQRPNTAVRCCDLLSGGVFFSHANTVIAKLGSRGGKQIVTDLQAFDNVLRYLTSISKENLEKLGGRWNSVTEFNSNNTEQLPECVTVLNLNFDELPRDMHDTLSQLMINGEKTGLSFVIVDRSLQTYMHKFDFNFLYGSRGIFSYLFQTFYPLFNLRETMAEEVLADIVKTTVVNTIVKENPLLEERMQAEIAGRNGASSTGFISIPFAVDRFLRIVNFEIGGSAPPHALISGGTGSGKSTLLHSLISGVIRTYHPDDVELWLVDYKVNEFRFYDDNVSPHFKLIAHDTSLDFSWSLLDKLFAEYERRRGLFEAANVQDLKSYREKFGERSLPRILVLIDEFQILTQAATDMSAKKDYKTILENLLRLTRAAGIHFIFSSQTIASGLSGLSQAARDQIGVRLALKHQSAAEIMETLTLTGPGSSEIVERVSNQQRGQGLYKRVYRLGEVSQDDKAAEMIQCSILCYEQEMREAQIAAACAALAGTYTPKELVIVSGHDRKPVGNYSRHPLQQFIAGSYTPPEDELLWLPAAPTTIDDSYSVLLEDASGTNILLVGENDDLRESVVVHSVCGFLTDPKVRVKVMIIDSEYPDRERLLGHLKKIHSDRLELYTALPDILSEIRSLEKIRPLRGRKEVCFWYGLDKLKNEIFLAEQDEEEPAPAPAPAAFADMGADMDPRMLFMNDLAQKAENGEVGPKPVPKRVVGEKLSVEDCAAILSRAMEMGPENGYLHFVVFNNQKVMLKSGFYKKEYFENRIATAMSLDDAFVVLGNASLIKRADDVTVVYSSGGAAITPLRPYLLPEQAWYDAFNEALDRN